MSRGDGLAPAGGCLSAVVCIASGSFAAYAGYNEWSDAYVVVAGIVCLLTLLVTFVCWGEIAGILIDLLEAIFSAFH